MSAAPSSRALPQVHPPRSTEPPTPRVTRSLSSTPQLLHPPTRSNPLVPGYEIIRELGSGGMGIVYLARQVGIGRLVALKMLRAEVLSDDTFKARFADEARIVANLRHPNIVQLYEYGETFGTPFVTLEYVAGPTLAARILDRAESPEWCVELIEKLARVVQAAHDQGVIHRDLKPANVLLAGDGEPGRVGNKKSGDADSSSAPFTCTLTPKVTDFGLAKVLHERAGHTQTGFAAGTPGYMAPEQITGEKDLIGPWTDVYALGTILFQLLTGKLPFTGTNPAATMLATTNAPVPSLLKARPDVPRDLDTICRKCLAKVPGERYLTAAALATDLQRFREGRPIVARPAGPAERTWKFVRRYPVASGLSLGLLLSLVVGLAATSVMYLRAEDQRAEAHRAERDAWAAHAAAAGSEARAKENEDRAVKAAADAKMAEARLAQLLAEQNARQRDLEALNGFVIDDILSAPRPRAYSAGGIGHGATLKEALDVAAGKIEERFKNSPALFAAADYAVGESYRQIGDYRAAVKHLRRAVETREAFLPEDRIGMNRARHGLANAFNGIGKPDEAAKQARLVIADEANLANPDQSVRAGVRRDLGHFLLRQGDVDGAIALFEESHAIVVKLSGPDHPNAIACLVSLASAHERGKRPEQAMTLAQEAVERSERALGPTHHVTGKSLAQLGNLRALQRDIAGAEDPLRRATDIHITHFGATHPDTVILTYLLAQVLLTQKKFEEAETRLKPASAAAREMFGPTNATTVELRMLYVTALRKNGKLDDAEEEAVAVLADIRSFQPDHPRIKHVENAVMVIRGEKAKARPVAPAPRLVK